jgi:hypothetical protein
MINLCMSFALGSLVGAAAAQSVTLRHDVELTAGCDDAGPVKYPAVIDLTIKDRTCTGVAEAQWRDKQSARVTLIESICGVKAGTAWIVQGTATQASNG